MAQTIAADAQLLDFVRKKADTFVKWDLIRFFHNNPHAANTADNIARFAARDARTVEHDLEELVASGVLEMNVSGKTRVYHYAKNQDMRDLIGKCVVACDAREFRVQAINPVIEGLR